LIANELAMFLTHGGSFVYALLSTLAQAVFECKCISLSDIIIAMNEIEKYLSKIEPKQRAALERVRALVIDMIPGISEAIGYGMPVFKYKEQYLIGYAGFKNHMSVFPGAEPVELMKDQLKDFKLSKGTVQFTLDHPLPDATLREIVSLCLGRVNR